MKKYLHENWQLYNTKHERMNATVPGCNYLDLKDNGVIKDPFLKTNEKDTLWVASEDWIYETSFNMTSSELDFDGLTINFKQLDTVCDVFLNGRPILKANNCFLPYQVDVKGVLIKGENKLSVYFYSPVNYVKDKQSNVKCPNNSNGLTGIPHIRKPGYHFGWDWGPNLPLSGITDSVYIEGYNYAKLDDVLITQSHHDSVDVKVDVKIKKFRNVKSVVKVELTYPNGETHAKNINDNGEVTFTVDNPILWQPNGYTDRKTQPLYKITTSLIVNGKVIDEDVKNVGLRTIELDRSKDKYGSNFCFKVNGNPIFMKGANYIPTDSFITRQYGDLEKYVKVAVDSNFNMLRIWGGGYYGSSELYDLCDKYGILLWQDFAFACQPYPFFNDEFTQNVLDEVEANVKRLRHHACLALWCGNNEIEVMSPAWLNRKEFVKWTEKFFYDILPNKLRELDGVTPYIPGSPVGYSHNKGVSDDNVGDTHLWAVWHGLQSLRYYRTRPTRFCSEFGFESLPNLNTIEKYSDEKDYSLKSKVFLAHQKCLSGNKKMQFYITENFRLPKNFTDYVYLSQICQAECVRDATEYWRRNEGRCNGSLYWQFNDCWPVCSWAGMDYYLEYKALQYEAKKFFQPVTISIDDDKDRIKVYAICDRETSCNLTVKASLRTFDNDELFSAAATMNVEKFKPTVIFDFSTESLKKYDLKNAFLLLDAYEDDKKIARKTLLFDKEKNLNLGNPTVTVDVEKDGDYAVYKIKSNYYVRKFALYQKYSSMPFSDNYFDLVKDEEVVIRQEAKGVSLDDLKNGLSTKDASKIEPCYSKFKDWLIKAKIFIEPVNFFNYIYYKWII